MPRSSRCAWVRCSAVAPDWPRNGKWVTTSFIPQLEPVIWGSKEEDDAMKWPCTSCWEQGFDPRQIEHLFNTLNQCHGGLAHGPWIHGLGAARQGREAHLQTLLNGMLKADIELRARARVQSNSPDFTPWLPRCAATTASWPWTSISSRWEAQPGKRNFAAGRR